MTPGGATTVRRRTRLMPVLATLLLIAACSGTPISPSTPAPPLPIPDQTAVMLTVRVLERTSERPIGGASVIYNGEQRFTDLAGVAMVSVQSGAETAIAVSARAYESMGASGVLISSERWTFYLEYKP